MKLLKRIYYLRQLRVVYNSISKHALLKSTFLTDYYITIIWINLFQYQRTDMFYLQNLTLFSVSLTTSELEAFLDK